MYGRYIRSGILLSCGFGLLTSTSNSYGYVHLISSAPKEKRKIILTPFNDKEDSIDNESEFLNKSQVRDPRTFFETFGIEALKKVAVFHLIGFIGYLPYISDIASKLFNPLLPINLLFDSGLTHMFSKNLTNIELHDKNINSKEYSQYVDYCSWIFAFASAGGKCRALPGFLAMSISMYIYSIYKNDNYKKEEAIAIGTTSAVIANMMVNYAVPMYIAKMSALKIALVSLLNYSILSIALTKIIDEYIQGNNEEKLSSSVLSTYKWINVNMFIIDNVFGEK